MNTIPEKVNKMQPKTNAHIELNRKEDSVNHLFTNSIWDMVCTSIYL